MYTLMPGVSYLDFYEAYWSLMGEEDRCDSDLPIDDEYHRQNSKTHKDEERLTELLIKRLEQLFYDLLTFAFVMYYLIVIVKLCFFRSSISILEARGCGCWNHLTVNISQIKCRHSITVATDGPTGNGCGRARACTRRRWHPQSSDELYEDD